MVADRRYHVTSSLGWRTRSANRYSAAVREVRSRASPTAPRGLRPLQIATTEGLIGMNTSLLSGSCETPRVPNLCARPAISGGAQGRTSTFCRRLPAGLMVLALSLCLGPLPSSAQTCTPPVFCEGWARDSSHREVSLTRATICSNIPACPAECSTSATSALPSIRIGSLEHIVLAFSAPDACIPECSGAPPEPCYNLGISFRHKVDVSSEAVTGTYDCDLSDPGTVVSAGATFNATYLTGGTDNIVVSNVLYGSGTG